MNGRGKKQKGMRGEYEVRDMLQKEINAIYEAHNQKLTKQDLVDGQQVQPPHLLEIPQLERNLDQTREGGADIAGIHWAAVEVKRQENDAPFNQWWNQCKAAAMKKDEEGKFVLKDGFPIWEREPILIWRKNHCPWEVRMLGWLAVGGDTRNGMVRAPVDINLPTFLAYFRMRVEVELKREVQKSVLGRSALRNECIDGPLLAQKQELERRAERAENLQNHTDFLVKQHENRQKEAMAADLCGSCAAGQHWQCALFIRSRSTCCCTQEPKDQHVGERVDPGSSR